MAKTDQALLAARVKRLECAFVALASSVAPASRAGRDANCRALFQFALDLSREMSEDLRAEETRQCATDTNTTPR